jgi:type IV pilus assembly protein PilQ
MDTSERATSVPYLSRLPFLGALFRSNEIADDRKELLIFVSPRVVQSPGSEAS